MKDWTYKGHKLSITLDYEDDNVKAFHDVITPEGKTLCADISPYDTDPRTLEMWVDAGYPGRIVRNGCSCNHDASTLAALLATA